MANIKTLIVEDMPIALIGGLTVLEKFNLDVDSAENGNQALELASKIAYRLIFLDLGLPDMEGIEVARKLRENHTNLTLSDTLIIALTAHAEESYQNQCKAAGINGFLTKPLTDENVKDILRKFDKYVV